MERNEKTEIRVKINAKDFESIGESLEVLESVLKKISEMKVEGERKYTIVEVEI